MIPEGLLRSSYPARRRARCDARALPREPGGGRRVRADHPARSPVMTSAETPTTDPEHDDAQVERANGAGLTPVVFVHGLWLLPSSWDRWADAVRGGRLRRAHARLAGRSRDRRGGQRPPRGLRAQDRRPGRRPLRRDHPAGSTEKPAVIGHSFGGLLTQILAGRGLVGGLGRDRPGARSAACCRCRSRR